MAGVKVTVNAKNLLNRVKRYAANLETVILSEWPNIVLACMADILSRTPDPTMEYEFIMGERGGIGYGSNDAAQESKSGKPRSSAINSGSRVPFIRTPGMWLQEAVIDPSVYSANLGRTRFELGIGKVSALEALTKFSWTNVDGQGQTNTHTSDYGVWSFFEFGSGHTIQPRHWGGVSPRGNALGYKLRPSEDQAYWAMSKQYPKMRMFTGFDRAVFQTAVRDIIRAVQF